MRASFIVVAVLVALSAGCAGEPEQIAPDFGEGRNDEEEFQAQNDAFWRQTAEVDRINERARKEQDRIERQNDRWDRIITTWEEQARRQDAILEAEEKRLGIERDPN